MFPSTNRNVQDPDKHETTFAYELLLQNATTLQDLHFPLQIFVGNQFLGGASEVFDAFKDGRLQALLTSHAVPFDATVQLDPYTLLPNWLQPRASGETPACPIPPRR